MATTAASSSQAREVKDSAEDPFLTTPPNNRDHPQRFARFDSNLFALNPTTSPTQAKKALEAHLAETERRIQDASRLGTTLVEQRKALQSQLKEVEKRKEETEIGPALKQKLIDLEKEYNEVGRETARAFLAPKSRLASGEVASPFAESKHAGSPAVFATDAVNSPSKVSVPTSRAARNQGANKVQDIEFATQISTSLLAQVKHLQGVLAEREGSLRSVTDEKSAIEVEVENYVKRLRHMAESEQRYKDENWNLETKNRELIAAAKEASDREVKLNQNLTVTSADKTTMQKELDDLRQANGQLQEEHATSKKHHEAEVGLLRKTVIAHETQKSGLEDKVQQLMSHNEELAKAVASGRTRAVDTEHVPAYFDQSDEPGQEKTPDSTPPGSPTKGTPRNAMLETETLKSSLGHAHRMIQNLKATLHREKTEKIEIKRMLQDTRDELEQRRSDNSMGLPGSGAKKRRTADKDVFKKPAKPGLLGVGRSSKTELLEDGNWEDHDGQREVRPGTFQPSGADTQTETSDAFETANERDATETEAFITGAESLGDDSGQDTETEGTSKTKTLQNRPSIGKFKFNRQSYLSTASTSDGEDAEAHTPDVRYERFKARLSRGSAQQSKSLVPEEAFKDSPASVTSVRSNDSSVGATPQGQSLFAELGDLNGDLSDGEVDDTPSKISQTTGLTPLSRKSLTPRVTPLAPSALFKPEMKEMGTMTDDLEPVQRAEEHHTGIAATAAALAGAAGGALLADNVKAKPEMVDFGVQFDTPLPSPPAMADASAQHEQATVTHAAVQHEPASVAHVGVQRDLPGVSHSGSQYDLTTTAHAGSQYDRTTTAHAAIQHEPAKMSDAGVQHDIAMEEPAEEPAIAEAALLPEPSPALSFSSIDSQDIQPVAPKEATPPPQAESQDNNKYGMLGSLLGLRTTRPVHPQIAEDDTVEETRQVSTASQEAKLPLKSISDNVRSQESAPKPVLADQGSQTAMTWADMESVRSAEKDRPRRVSHSAAAIPALGAAAAAAAVLGEDPFTSDPKSRKSSESLGSVARARARMAEPGFNHEPIPSKNPKRPGSAGSQRSSLRTYPPLPPDHKETIAAAQQRVGSSDGPQIGTMGPPIAPASAYRATVTRPKTPSTQVLASPNRGSITPRAKAAVAERGEPSSPAYTGRSSVSSFASELDSRFNTPMPHEMHHGVDPDTDPRLIEAITQTMIGEHLWKYTRKTGRGDFSSTRHRRFFWVHPYTRTLYWSEKDPALAGRAQLKAKSVAIEAVRVVTDDNPYPPGLHRKSLVIITPGRPIKLTAPTGQRHETWFNALSYLILRVGDPYRTGAGEITQEDVDEFNPQASGHMSSTRRSRLGQAPSVLSVSSRASRQSTSRVASNLAYQPPVLQPSPSQPQISSMASRSGSVSRLSNTIRGMYSSRRNQSGAQSLGGSFYAGSDLHDSAEDLRQVIERQERESERLENARACCDGKHDVGSLNHRHGRVSGLSIRMGDQEL